ncbi:unnamed protein product [Porites evermanni]|uniref:Uncharacterized protein n=1 Tax=Porites evermanni TaxID=104178 RepID=A0ABN8LVP5_9CNID|nr:unnamed protein product [Porites evermanni]
MSSEHSVSEDNLDQENSSDDENVPRKKVLCRRPLPWRSQELNNLFLKLDQKANRKRSQRSSSMTIDRRDGSPSEREAPDDAPEFALSSADLHGEGTCDACLRMAAGEASHAYDNGEIPPPIHSSQQKQKYISASSFSFLRVLIPQKAEDLVK